MREPTHPRTPNETRRTTARPSQRRRMGRTLCTRHTTAGYPGREIRRGDRADLAPAPGGRAGVARLISLRTADLSRPAAEPRAEVLALRYRGPGGAAGSVASRFCQKPTS